MRGWWLLLGLALTGCKKEAIGTTGMDAKVRLDDPIPLDPAISTGVLDNGMRYYLEYNGVPSDKAVMRLAVDAGSNLEDEDQVGLAHFLEHMAFNGTEKYPGNDLVAYLESTGVQFGPHLNAHTSFDETIYKLTVRTDRVKEMQTGLDVLREWACCLLLTDEEIEKERGVVLEEWRLREGVTDRSNDVRYPMMYADARHIDRMPIGTSESLEAFDPESVRRFYADWYRPDLMAIIVVGDFHVARMEARIREAFGSLPARPEAERRERTRFDVPVGDGREAAVFTDPEVTDTTIRYIAKQPSTPPKTFLEFKAQIAGELALSAINERLSELSRDAASPLLEATFREFRLTPTLTQERVWLKAKEGRAQEAFEVVLTELKRFQSHGVTEAELGRARASEERRLARLEEQVDIYSSTMHATEIVELFIEDTPTWGLEREAGFSRKAVDALTLEEVNAWAAAFHTSPSTYVFAEAPSGASGVPTTDGLETAIDAAANATVDPPAVHPDIPSLVPTPKTQGVVKVDTETHWRLDMKQRKLRNGAMVYSIEWGDSGSMRFKAFRDAGTFNAPDDQVVLARMASEVQGLSGLGEHSSAEVARYLKGTNIWTRTDLHGEDATIYGGLDDIDLPVLLELLHARFTAADFDEEALTRTKSRIGEYLHTRTNNPNARFEDAWSTLFWGPDPRRMAFDPAAVEAATLDDIQSAHAHLMGSPEQWSFLFVGDIPDDFEEHIGRWLGTIPETDAGWERNDRATRRQSGVKRVEVEGTTDRARFRTEFWAPLEVAPDFRYRTELGVLAEVVRTRLRETLREELGGVYGVQVQAGSWVHPYDGVRLRIEFQCDPERVAELETAMEGVLESLRTELAPPDAFDAAIAKRLEARKQHGWTWWSNGIADAFVDGQAPEELENYRKYVDETTVERVQALAVQVLDVERRGTVVLRPAAE